MLSLVVASNSTDTTLTRDHSEEKEDLGDDVLTAPRIIRRERPGKRNFSEPMSDQEAMYSPVFTGVYNKLGAAPSGVLASQYDIICVDTVPFQGDSHFPASLTQTLRELGDLACLAVPWTVGAKTVLGRRQRNDDGFNKFSDKLELFDCASACMPENNVLHCSYNNCLTGYFQTNTDFDEPEIQMWRSVRRGIVLQEGVDYTPHHASIASLAGPTGVLDRVTSTLDVMGNFLTASDASIIGTFPVAFQSFECLIVMGRPDADMLERGLGLFLFVTNWKRVYSFRGTCFADYQRALKANLQHRRFYEFEKMCIEIEATVGDIESALELSQAQEMRLDVVRLH